MEDILICLLMITSISNYKIPYKLLSSVFYDMNSRLRNVVIGRDSLYFYYKIRLSIWCIHMKIQIQEGELSVLNESLQE